MTLLKTIRWWARHLVEITIGRIVCAFRGHQYGPAADTPWCYLCFCPRCDKEVLGRSMKDIDDLEPVPDWLRDEMEELDYREVMT